MKNSEYQGKPKKSLGQNFLVDESVVPRILELNEIDDSWGVIEIGPGRGALTAELLEYAGKVVAVELDSELVPALNKRFAKNSNFKLINADIMSLNIGLLIREEFEGMKVAVFGNLPYNITTQIITQLLENRLPIEMIVAVVQREAAQRLCAEPKGRLCNAATMTVRYFSDPHILFDIPPEAFEPAPKVTSSAIRLDVLAKPSAAPIDEKFMFSLIKAAYSGRRKTLPNAISASTAMDKSAVESAMLSLSLPLTLRAENISVDEYAALSDRLAGKSGG